MVSYSQPMLCGSKSANDDGQQNGSVTTVPRGRSPNALADDEQGIGRIGVFQTLSLKVAILYPAQELVAVSFFLSSFVIGSGMMGAFRYSVGEQLFLGG